MPPTHQPAPESPRLHVVGLGSGEVELLTLGAWRSLTSGHPVRTGPKDEEMAQVLTSHGIPSEAHVGSPEDLLDWASYLGEAIYAVGGDPFEADETLSLLRLAAARGVKVEVTAAAPDPNRLPAGDPLTLAHSRRAAEQAGAAFERLVQLMARLRGPNGCPWDRQQTHESLVGSLLEEAHEVIDVIERGGPAELKDELGDLLLQVVFHSELATEAGSFDAAEVVEDLIEKLHYRHPHVFGEDAELAPDAPAVIRNWERLKALRRTGPDFQDIPRTLPALLYAFKVLRRSDISRDALAATSEEEVGKALLDVVMRAERAGIDPEGALRRVVDQLTRSSSGDRGVQS